MRRPEAAPALVGRLGDEDRDVRLLAAETLARMSEPKGVTWLLGLAADGHEAKEAIETLSRVIEVAVRGLDDALLRTIARLDGVVHYQYMCDALTADTPQMAELPVDCAPLRKAATEELMHRSRRELPAGEDPGSVYPA